MALNVLKPFGIVFDKYPFILLNLALSTLAALQAPLIMMSQNRASDYDRLQAKNDYNVNKVSEEGIRLLHTKIGSLSSARSVGFTRNSEITNGNVSFFDKTISEYAGRTGAFSRSN